MNSAAHSLAEAPPPSPASAPVQAHSQTQAQAQPQQPQSQSQQHSVQQQQNQHSHQLLHQQQQHHHQPPLSPPPSASQPTSSSIDSAAAVAAAAAVLPSISSPTLPQASLPSAFSSTQVSNPDELPPLRQPSPSSPAHYSFEQHQQQQQQQLSHHHLHPTTPPLRKDTSSSISTQATTATLASIETNNTSRRTGPLSQQSRERAALIRKLGACNDCRRRRVACHPSHHNMTWEDVVSKFHRSHSPTIQDIAPSLAAAGRPLSPAPASNFANVQPIFTHDPQEMEIDSTPAPHQPGRPPLSEARIRTPLPSGPRLEKSLSLPGIESFKNDLQTNVGRMLSTPGRDRYSSVSALLLFWQDDSDTGLVQAAVGELADVFDKYYHYKVQVQSIPSSTESSRSSWRWLSRQLSDFTEDRDQRDVLKVVYYVGHTYLDGNREMILASAREPERASIIRWGGIQQILEEACADTLLIMDAAYYPFTKMVRRQGILELLAASNSEDHFNTLGRCSFTRALAEHLRTRAARLNPLSVAELHAALFAHYPKMVQDVNPEKEVITSFPSPLHMMMSGNSRLPSIFMSPVYQNSPTRNSLSYENCPQLHLSVRLNDDNVDIESWNEWLRLMPEGIKDVKVDGPFRSAFR